MRWVVTCIALLFGFGDAIVSATEFPKIPGVFAVILALTPYIFSYLWFVRWPCPRCGRRYTTPDAHALKRSRRCSYCGLAKNEVPTLAEFHAD